MLRCPPVAVAIAQQRKCGVSHAKSNRLQFNVVEVSDSMGWESGPVKRQLKLLHVELQPVAVAIAQQRKCGVSHAKSNRRALQHVTSHL